MDREIRHIIDQIRIINDKYNALSRLTGERFNVFSILEMERNEVETHSRFIYELINPIGSHDKEDLFLSLFLKYVVDLHEPGKIIKVSREELILKNRRIDFYIETEKYQIGIEMKLDADDQKNQLIDYYKELEARCKKKQEAKLFYLTLDEHEPEEKSTAGKLEVDKDFKLISFEFDILKWLDKCIEKSATIATLREGIIQYRNLVRKLTNQTNAITGEEMEKLVRDSKDIEAMQTIVNEYPRIWAKKEAMFWDDLWNILEERIEKNDCNFELHDYYGFWLNEDNELIDEEETINLILENRNKKYHLVGFVLQKDYKKFKTCIRISAWDSNINISIWFEENKTINLNKNSNLVSICNDIGFIRKYQYIRYMYIKNKITFYGRYQGSPTYDLFDNDKYQEYIQSVTDELMDVLSLYQKNEKKIKKELTLMLED